MLLQFRCESSCFGIWIDECDGWNAFGVTSTSDEVDEADEADEDVLDELETFEDAELLFNCLSKDRKENQQLFEDNTSNYFLGKYMCIPTIKETDIPPLIKADKNSVEIFTAHEE